MPSKTLFKARVAITDAETGFYEDALCVLAAGLDEDASSLGVRLVAYCLLARLAHAEMGFVRGFSPEDRDILRLTDEAGQTVHIADFGLPEVRYLRKEAGLSRKVTVFAFGEGFEDWHERVRGELERIDNLEVVRIGDDGLARLASCISRSMHLGVAIQEDVVWVSDDTRTEEIGLERLPKKGY